jgi:hypothetical protein
VVGQGRAVVVRQGRVGEREALPRRRDPLHVVEPCLDARQRVVLGDL